MLLRISDRRRAENELRRDVVEGADALEASQHIGDVRAEHASIRMNLVDDDVAQALEELRPLGVMRQNRLMQHIWVADDDVAMNANRAARIARRIAIERESTYAELARS